MLRSSCKSCKKTRSKKTHPGCYAVIVGRKNGIFLHWTDACKSMEGVHGNKHKGCSTIEARHKHHRPAGCNILDTNTTDLQDATFQTQTCRMQHLRHKHHRSAGCNISDTNTTGLQDATSQTQIPHIYRMQHLRHKHHIPAGHNISDTNTTDLQDATSQTQTPQTCGMQHLRHKQTPQICRMQHLRHITPQICRMQHLRHKHHRPAGCNISDTNTTDLQDATSQTHNSTDLQDATSQTQTP